MAVSVNSVIDRVQRVLQDTTGVRWPIDDELVLWVNDAQREIALLKPDASAQNTRITLVAGTKQTIPDDGNRLLKVVRNMRNPGSGFVGAKAVRLVSGEVLDAQTPEWHDPEVTGAAAHTNVVQHYVYDDSNPRNFYVYPGATVDSIQTGTVDEGTYLEIIYSANPSAVAAGDNLSIPDIYANSIMNYTLYMAYQKDAEFAGNQQRAQGHYQLFLTTITGKGQVDAVTSPSIDVNKAG